MFKVYGENTITGNTWLCETVGTRAEAEQLAYGYKRLEDDYKIAYYVEFDEDARVADAREISGCYCPSDCGCKSEYRATVCGCTGRH